MVGAQSQRPWQEAHQVVLKLEGLLTTAEPQATQDRPRPGAMPGPPGPQESRAGAGRQLNEGPAHRAQHRQVEGHPRARCPDPSNTNEHQTQGAGGGREDRDPGEGRRVGPGRGLCTSQLTPPAAPGPARTVQPTCTCDASHLLATVLFSLQPRSAPGAKDKWACSTPDHAWPGHMLTILALKRPWASSPTKVSLLGSDLRSRCFLIPSTASR